MSSAVGMVLVMLLVWLGAAVAPVLAAEPEHGPAAADRQAILFFASNPPDYTHYLDVVGQWLADDFEAWSAGAATGVSFRLNDLNLSFPGSWDGLIRWWIHLDSGGLPGAEIATGFARDVGYQADPDDPQGDGYLVWFNLGEQVHLSTGTRYWLSMRLNRTWAYTTGLCWTAAAPSLYSNAAYYQLIQPYWHAWSLDFSFSIEGNGMVTYISADGFESGDTTLWSASVP
jgi:hypothetical protein